MQGLAPPLHPAVAKATPKVAFGESTASVECGNVKMLPVSMFPSATHSGAYFPIPIAPAAEPPFLKQLG